MSLGSLFKGKILKPILKAQGSPESIARGGAMGMWVALTPTVGVQMIMVLALSVPLRSNVPVALAMVWISNPVTMVPLYFGFYWLGAQLLGRSATGYGSVAESVGASIDLAREVGLLEALQKLGDEILWPMALGSLVIASAVALPTYHLLLWACRRGLERRLVAGLEHGRLEIVKDRGIQKVQRDGSEGAAPAQEQGPERKPAPTAAQDPDHET